MNSERFVAQFTVVNDLLQTVDCTYKRVRCTAYMAQGISKNFEFLESRARYSFENIHKFLEEFNKEYPDKQRLHELWHNLSNGKISLDIIKSSLSSLSSEP